MKHIFIILIIPVLFSCSNKNEDLLNERFQLANGTIEYFINRDLSKVNSDLFYRLNSFDKVKLDTIKQLSSNVNNYLNTLKDEMVNNSGGINEYGEIINDNDFSRPLYFIENYKYGRSFKDTLNSIPYLIAELNIFDAPPIIFDGRDDPFWSKFPNLKSKTAFQLLFANASLSSALLSISQLQHRLLEYERKAYEKFLLDELDSLRLVNF